MIIGIGSDLCDIRRIERSLAEFGDRFTRKVFTQTEIARAERRPLTRAGSYAKRFAAKEACSKALGTGLRRGVYLASMGVTNLPSGAPTLTLIDGAALRLQELAPEGTTPVIHLSLTDDYPWAQAFVVIEARSL